MKTLSYSSVCRAGTGTGASATPPPPAPRGPPLARLPDAGEAALELFGRGGVQESRAVDVDVERDGAAVG